MSDHPDNFNPFEFIREEKPVEKAAEPKPVEPDRSTKHQPGRITLEPVNTTINPIHRVGEHISLGRDAIDPSDASISREKHVEFVRRDNKWYIENRGSNEATFIQIREATEIKDGTLIVLGKNKVFRFKSEDK